MTGLTATSTSPATTNTAAIAIAPYPASSKRSGTSTSRTPKNNAGSVLSQRPPTNARSRSARAIAPGSEPRPARAGLGGAPRRGRARRTRPRRTTPDSHDVGEAAEHRADDEAEDCEAEYRPERLPAPLARHVDGHPRQRAGPCGRARDALDEARQAEGERAAGECEGKARDREHRQTGEDAALWPDPSDEETARHSADERSRAVRSEEEAGLELRQVVRVCEVREERDDRPEQHRVEEHDGAREDDDPAHSARIRRRTP